MEVIAKAAKIFLPANFFDEGISAKKIPFSFCSRGVLVNEAIGGSRTIWVVV